MKQLRVLPYLLGWNLVQQQAAPQSGETHFVKLPQAVHLYPFVHLDRERCKTTTQGHC